MVQQEERLQSCIEACLRCARECDNCAGACLRERDPKPLARCIALDIDCAAICRLAAAMMSRGSDFSHEICRLCGVVCDACGAECDKHSHMQHCRICAEACHACAEECRAMQPANV